MPTACSVWNGHVVATIDEETGEALLLSLKEWSDVSSNDDDAEDPTESSRIAAEYAENGLSGWQVPTIDKLREVRNSNNFTKLNNSILELNGEKLEDINKKKIYVCSNGLLNWASGSQNYTENIGFLRLVKPVKFIKNN